MSLTKSNNQANFAIHTPKTGQEVIKKAKSTDPERMENGTRYKEDVRKTEERLQVIRKRRMISLYAL